MSGVEGADAGFDGMGRRVVGAGGGEDAGLFGFHVLLRPR